MGNWSEDESSTRVDIFKESGKWYTTVAVKMNYREPIIHDAVRKGLATRLEPGQFSGMMAVCIEPYHEHSHPVSFII